jgi:3(or 17)beta-hydroxysteroid dehydrogenase
MRDSIGHIGIVLRKLQPDGVCTSVSAVKYRPRCNHGDSDLGRVQNKVALITGGASGIGLATAQLFADEGASIALTDLNPPSFKPATACYKLDVTREDEWIAVTDRIVRDLGRIDILVNSAGVSLLKDIEATTLEEWRALMAVNLDGTFLGCKHAVRVMKDRGGGSIVNMSSVAGIIGTGHLAAYGASKGGVRLLTKSVALHCARKGYNIRCNSVHRRLQIRRCLKEWSSRHVTPRSLPQASLRQPPSAGLPSPLKSLARSCFSPVTRLHSRPAPNSSSMAV